MSNLYGKICDLAEEHYGWFMAIWYVTFTAIGIGLTVLLKELGFYRWLYS